MFRWNGDGCSFLYSIKIYYFHWCKYQKNYKDFFILMIYCWLSWSDHVIVVRCAEPLFAIAVLLFIEWLVWHVHFKIRLLEQWLMTAIHAQRFFGSIWRCAFVVCYFHKDWYDLVSLLPCFVIELVYFFGNFIHFES